jgi:hypothetical protein
MASGEPAAITLEPVNGGSLHVTWDRDALEAHLRGEPRDRPRSPWSVAGEVDWGLAEEVRLVSALFEDGRAVAIAAVRPRGAPGHDRDAVAASLVSGGEPVPVAEVLLSTEYDPEGLPRRLGVELVLDPGSPPLRIAADREGEVEARRDDVLRKTARMTFRLEGGRGAGLYEVLRPS